jgi:hypothetical protein
VAKRIIIIVLLLFLLLLFLLLILGNENRLRTLPFFFRLRQTSSLELR